MTSGHWLDRAFVRLSPPVPCLQDGWGPLAPLDLRQHFAAPPAPLTLQLGPPHRRGGLLLREGRFPSPDDQLPPPLREARVLHATAADRYPYAACVALSAWNDEGFDFRLQLLGPLIHEGLAVVMLEHPGYGSRRTPGRASGAPRTVAELIRNGRATLHEARALVTWLRQQGHPQVGVLGYSMGGHLAALTAATLPFRARVVALAPSCTPSSVFLDGILAPGTNLAALADDGDTCAAAVRLRRLLDQLSVTSLAPPLGSRHAVIVGTRRDAIVPPGEMRTIARHWRASLRWIDSGHVGTVIFHRRALRAAITAGFT